MKSLIALLLIALVSSNEIIETKINLRRTADIELNQIVDFLKEYFEKAIDLYLKYCDKTVNYFESKNYEQLFIKTIQIIQEIKNYLSKFTFNELKEKFILFFEKYKTFFNDFNPDFIVDYFLDIIDNWRAFLATIYFQPNIEKFVVEIREEFMRMRLYKAEEELFKVYAEYIYELNRININEVLQKIIRGFNSLIDAFNEEKFRKQLEQMKIEMQKGIMKMEIEMNELKKKIPDIFKENKKRMEEIPKELEKEEVLAVISEKYKMVKQYIDNFDFNQITKIIKFVLDKYVAKIKKENLELIYKQIKEYIPILKEYISEKNYNYLIEYLDKLIELSKKESEKIDTKLILQKIDKFLTTIKNFFRDIDEVEFIKQLKEAAKNFINYLIKFNYEDKINKYIDYCVRLIKVFREFNFGFIMTIYTLSFKTLQVLYESTPQVYNKNKVIIYGDDFFS